MTEELPRPLRVCVTGAECTGKTTLARALGEHFDAPVIYETVRDYFGEKMRLGDATVFAGDIVRVIDIQLRTEARAPEDVPLVVYDTDLFTIAVWHERVLGHRIPELDELVADRFKGSHAMDLYILTSPDIAFEYDGVRGSETNRDEMHQVFMRSLAAAGRHFISVSGTLDERCRTACAEIERLLAARGPAENPQGN